MRIVILLSNLGTGGAERTALNLAKFWLSIGHEAKIVLTSRAASAHYVIPDGCEVQVLHRRFRTFQLRQAARGWDVAVSFLTNVNVRAVVALIGSGIPLVVCERTYPPMFDPGVILRIGRRLTYPLAQMVVVQSPEAIQWLRHSIRGAPGIVLPNPVPYPVSGIGPSLHLPKHAKMLLAVGRLSAEKRFDLLIEAFALADVSDWGLLIVGEGPLREDLQARIDSAGQAERVLLAGNTGNMDICYRAAEAFAMTSLFEGFPNGLAEAISYGLPCLATDCLTGPRELLPQGAGMLVPVDLTASQLAARLKDFLSKPWPQAPIAAIQFREQYSSETVGRMWISLLEALAVN